ncbi:hypothetical protein BJ508DRAFT_410185 [Ascobolus immersus RN42]|uniref:Uncharacterized protein n=1 Tax=Ascobolus immersus RN42 TaxID=1160509 RepID=A0A3N4IMR5_ASCIM|nr:hypothetical protein BJ508DRAFT_410185 [Ascobolus immersus RN42]
MNLSPDAIAQFYTDYEQRDARATRRSRRTKQTKVTPSPSPKRPLVGLKFKALPSLKEMKKRGGGGKVEVERIDPESLIFPEDEEEVETEVETDVEMEVETELESEDEEMVDTDQAMCDAQLYREMKERSEVKVVKGKKRARGRK